MRNQPSNSPPAPQRGRDHYAVAWSTVVAGGGVKGGQAVGKTSKDGTTVEDRPTSAAEAAGHEAVLSLVGLGCGVGVVPELVARQSVSAGDLEVIGFDPPLPAFDIAACTTADRLRRRPVAALWASLTAGSG